jgi:hypothetical protein
MAGAIGKGDWVECVDASPMRHIPTGLVAGCIYCVEGLTPARMEGNSSLGSGLLLVGIRHPGNWRGDFAASRFRPIYRPNSELLESLLRKADEPVRVDA